MVRGVACATVVAPSTGTPERARAGMPAAPAAMAAGAKTRRRQLAVAELEVSGLRRRLIEYLLTVHWLLADQDKNFLVWQGDDALAADHLADSGTTKKTCACAIMPARLPAALD